MSLSNPSDQNSLDLTEKSVVENLPITVNQAFLTLAFEYQELKKALKTLAQKENLNLDNWCLILKNTTKINNNKYELTFFVKNQAQFAKIDTDVSTFYSFKEVFNNALNNAKKVDQASTRSSLIQTLDVVADGASWATAISVFIDYANSNEEISSLTTTLQIEAYYELVQSGFALAQGAFQIAQVVSWVQGGELISLSERIGTKILGAAAKATGSTKTALSVMGTITSNSLSVVTGVFSIVVDSLLLSELKPGDVGFAGSVTSLSFNVLSFALTLTSIISTLVSTTITSVASATTAAAVASFAGGIAVPLAGLSLAIGALINELSQNYQSCRNLGNYVLTLEKDYHSFGSKFSGDKGNSLNLSEGMVIVKSIDLQALKIELLTPILPGFYPKRDAFTPIGVTNWETGDSWETNYRKFTQKDLPLIKTLKSQPKEIILPGIPMYKMQIQAISIGGTEYAETYQEIMEGLPKLIGGGDNVSWCYTTWWYMMGFTTFQPIVYQNTTIRVNGSDQDEILISPPLEELKAEEGEADTVNKYNQFVNSVRNFVTYEIHKSSGCCTLVISKYAKYKVTLGKDATLVIDSSKVGRGNIELLNSKKGKINFGSNWVEINFPEQQESIPPVIIIDSEGKCVKVNFVTQSYEVISIDSKLYYEATGKSIEKELIEGKSLDPLIPSLPPTIPLTNAAKNYDRPQDSQRVPYGFYFNFNNKKVIKYLDSRGQLPNRLQVVKCLPGKVILRQRAIHNPGDITNYGFYYYVQEAEGNFKIALTGKTDSQSLNYLIDGQLPPVSNKAGILRHGCPNCRSGNIAYRPSGLPPNAQSISLIKPRLCLDCKLPFPKYPPFDLFSPLSPSEKQEVHKILEVWAKTGKPKNYIWTYIRFLFQISEDPNIAVQQNEDIKLSLSNTITTLVSSESNTKLIELQTIYWCLEEPEKRYLGRLLGPQILYLINTPTISHSSLLDSPATYNPPNQPLSAEVKQQIDSFLLNWGQTVHKSLIDEDLIDLIEYFTFKIPNLSRFITLVLNPPQNQVVSYSDIIYSSSDALYDLQNYSQKRIELVKFYIKLTTREQQVYVRELLREYVASLLPPAVLPKDSFSTGALLSQVRRSSIVDLLNIQISPVAEISEPEPPPVVEFNEIQKRQIHERLQAWARSQVKPDLPENRVLIEYLSLVIDGQPASEQTQQEFFEELINSDVVVQEREGGPPVAVLARLSILFQIYDALETLDQKNYVKELLGPCIRDLLALKPGSLIPPLSLEITQKTVIQDELRNWFPKDLELKRQLEELIQSYNQQELDEHGDRSDRLWRELENGSSSHLLPFRKNFLVNIDNKFTKLNEKRYLRELLGTVLAVNLLPLEIDLGRPYP